MSHIGLFATRANTKLPLYVSPVPDSLAWKQDAFQHPWNDLNAYAFPLFTLLRQVLSRMMHLMNLSLFVVAPLLPQKEWFSDLLALLVKEPLEISLLWHLLVQPHIRKFHRGLEKLHLFRQNTYLQNKKHTLTCQGGTGCYRFNYQLGS